MTADVDDVVHASRDLVIAVLVPDGSVSGEVEAAEWVVVSRKEAIVMIVYGSRHPGPEANEISGQ